MPLLGFMVFVDKVLAGKKTQTIRKARKKPIKIGDRLYLYQHTRTPGMKKMGEAVCTNTYRVHWNVLRTLFYGTGLAYSDGFDTKQDAVDWFIAIHKPTDITEFDVIQWEKLELCT